jgi:hypothetical protein
MILGVAEERKKFPPLSKNPGEGTYDFFCHVALTYLADKSIYETDLFLNVLYRRHINT